MDVAKTTTKQVTFVSVCLCDACRGSGLKKGKKESQCQTCKGSGQVSYKQGGFHMAAECPVCNGKGKSIPKGSECGDCNGVGKVKKRQTLPLDIPAGVEDGMSVRVSGKGDIPLNGQGSHGDLILEIKVILC
jgi:molecular chaperone DnaJ